MADRQRQVPENAPGAFFVDVSCIDCDTCRRLAPATFRDAGDHSYVYRQPEQVAERRRALQALLACPVGCIGTSERTGLAEALADFPLPLNETVAYAGFAAADSFGASSYFVRHPDGNWLIDSPRFIAPLVKRFEALGGIARIFLTHRDDVADAEQYAAHFGAQRIIHRQDLLAQPQAEIVLEGEEPVALGAEFLALPTPGHTRGHAVLLYRNAALFAGDHLWWDRQQQRLSASRGVCWYSWPEQTRSMARLLDYRFEWVFPGHRDWVQLPSAAMHQDLERLVKRMHSVA